MISPWLWSKRVDLAVFGGSAAVALAIGACSGWLAPDGQLPTWGWFVFVLGLDVCHVWLTLYRTYFDREEIARRRTLYFGLPVLCYLAGFALHLHSPLTFWRVLAYVAVFHFVRQQVGWVAIYRARAGERERIDRWLDNAAIYSATGWPLLYWHAHLPRKFNWFLKGDFLNLAWLEPAVSPLGVIYVAVLVSYALRVAWRQRQGAVFNAGKHTVVLTTALIWFIGIVATDEDFTFTVTNVTIHAIPYAALLWAYARERAVDHPAALSGRIVAMGLGMFLAVALAFAFAEELLWERLIWYDRPGWFGGPVREEPLLSPWLLTIVVPLLALPQAVHYALDGLIWRSKDAGPELGRALGFTPPLATPRQL